MNSRYSHLQVVSTMHIYTIAFPTSLQVLLGGIVPRKLGTGFYLGSLVGGINKIYDPYRFDWAIN